MKIQVLRKDDKGYIELPDEIATLENIEIFSLREGYYLLSAPLESIKPRQKEGKLQAPRASLEGGEKSVLEKLLAVKFQLRTPKLLEKSLGEKERYALQGLIAKKYVNVFKSSKYPDGVYNISDSVYPMLKQPAKQINQQSPAIGSRQQASNSPLPAPVPQNFPPARAPSSIFTSDYAIILDQNEAKSFSDSNRDRIRNGEVFAIRGFDGKFYAVKKNYYLKFFPLIKEVLEKDSTIDTIAKRLEIEGDAVKALLIAMSDKGEVIEKRKGLYALV